MEIDCKHVWREVSNYLDGEITAELRAALEEHVRGCKRCTAVVDGTRNTLQLMGDDRVLELPLGFEQRLRRRLEPELAASRAITVQPKSYFRWLVLATAAALLIGALTMGSRPAWQGQPQRAEMAHPAAGIPGDLMVVVSTDGKMFHGGTACALLHDKSKLRTIPASQALREGYTPCVHCMKQYLNAGLTPPEEVADADRR